MNPVEIQACGFSPAALEEVARLLQSAFPGASHLNRSYLEWYYLLNPDGRALAFNAYAGGELVAHFAASPMRARIFGQEELGLLTQNAATRPDFGGRGIFKALVERTMEAGSEAGFGFAVAMANAESAFAFVERLGFNYVCHLDVKLGVGFPPASTSTPDLDFDRIWTADALCWRLLRPDRPYRLERRGDATRIYADSGRLGIQVELATVDTRRVPEELPALSTRNPLRLWIGLDPGRSWRWRPYVDIPVRLRPAPLNFTVRDLKSRGRPFDPQRVRVAALDFDAY